MKEKLFTRNFTLLLVGQASSLLGNNTLKFALSMFVLEETGSATVFATILALAMAPTILLSPLGGILADRANRKSIMVALDSLSGLACCSPWETGCWWWGRCWWPSPFWGPSNPPRCRPVCPRCSLGNGCSKATRL